jgi:hypothetical protein
MIENKPKTYKVVMRSARNSGVIDIHDEYTIKSLLSKSNNGNRHLYFISDSNEIEVGDHYYFESEREDFIRQAKTVDRTETYWLDNDIGGGIILGKIIATTDRYLLCKSECDKSLSGKCICPNKILYISESFIDDYVKANGGIKQVQVEVDLGEPVLHSDRTVIIHQKTPTDEYILCSAIWYNDGKQYRAQPKNIEEGIVVCGLRHPNCIHILSTIFYPDFLTCEHCDERRIKVLRNQIQGFLTNKNRFVGREEAMEIAFNAKQISKKKKELFSEDLY